MKVKTTQSFFPTDAKVQKKTPNCDKYIVIKKSNNLIKNLSDNQQQNSINIFKNASVDGIYKFNYKQEKPVGGIQTFLKHKNLRKKKSNHFKLSTEQAKKSLYKSNIEEIQKKESQQTTDKKQIKNHSEQIYKKHESYSTIFDKNKQKQKLSRPLTSQNGLRTKSNQWIKNQTLSYHNKMAYLNQIYYKKPLIERYGDKYFQYWLRNRFEDNLPPPAYIYQIQDDTHKQIQKNQFISKLRKLHPGLKNRKKLIIKGHASKFL